MPKDSFDEMLREEERMAEERARINEQSVVGSTQNTGRNKSGRGGSIAAIFVVVFFVADVIAMLSFAKTNPLLCVPCLGSLFLVFGIIGLTQTKINWNTWPIIIFPIIGLLLTALPIADFVSKKTKGETIFTQHLIIALVSSAFFIAGVLMIVMPFLKRKFMLEKCTEAVMAKCVYLDSRISHGKHGIRYVYAPKWEYSVGGKVYEHQENTYTNVNVPGIGDEHEILVDPNDPDQIYRHNSGALIILVLMGLMFVIMSIVAVYAEFFA